MPLIIVAVGVALLLLLMLRFKLNGFLSLILVALAVGLMEGMPIADVMKSVKAGVGGTLGSLALVLAFPNLSKKISGVPSLLAWVARLTVNQCQCSVFALNVLNSIGMK